jgi:DNA-binding PadR family transcriptional regulator
MRDRTADPHAVLGCTARGGGGLSSALQKILLKGWVTAAWGTSETNRQVRFYKLTRDGVKQLEAEASQYDRQTKAIQAVLRTA